MDTLIELINTRLQALSDKLAGPHTPQELQAEVIALMDLIRSFKIRSELVIRLLDASTPESQRDDVRAALKAMHIEVEEGGETARLTERSKELIKRSAVLLAKAQTEINRTAHRFGGYVLKICGYCKGATDKNQGVCPACKDKGNVLMKEPVAVCPRCGGDGVNRGYPVVRRSKVCVECRGIGWVTVTE